MSEFFIQLVTDRQHCFQCHKTVTGKKKLSKCSRCQAITYCSKECQLGDWARHKYNCIPVMVTEIEGKGRGLVAARDIKMGELLFLDKTVIKLPKHLSNTKAYQSLKKQMGNPPTEAMLQLYKLPAGSKWSNVTNRSPRTTIREVEIFLHNSVTVGDSWILFVNAALLNHSCAPNAVKETFEPKDGTDVRVEVRAIKNITKGEEITVFYQNYKDYSYKELGSTTQERMMAIKKKFDFDCKCCVCSGKVPGQEDIIKELLELHGTLDDEAGQVLTPDRTPEIKKTPSDWAKDLKTIDKIVDLNQKLYIGSVYDKEWSLELLMRAAAMAGDRDLMKKAMEGCKKLSEDTNMIDSSVRYKCMKDALGLWIA